MRASVRPLPAFGAGLALAMGAHYAIGGQVWVALICALMAGILAWDGLEAPRTY